MKTILSFFLLLPSLAALSQQPYWQQEVNHKIDVSLNDREHSLQGRSAIEYINHSPDTLSFIWFHLWPNAYRNEQTAFAKQILRNEEGKKNWKKLKEKGYIDSLDFSVNGKKAKTEAHPEHIDVMKLLLDQPLLPGQSVQISTPFYVKLPHYISRSGHDGQQYMLCQWFPRPAVYDRKGWHPMPYLDMGEFYYDFGNYEISLTIPSEYIVAATGTLQTTDEISQYRKIGEANVKAASRKNEIRYQPTGQWKTLQWKAERVPDFAIFADKDFIIRYDTLQLSTRTVDVVTYHQPNGNRNWIYSTSYVKSGARDYSQKIGEYAWPVVQAVEGPKNESSGGMEYPMVTLITSPDANGELLDAVITHEVGHNWFYGMLASNERAHPWMDEGINTYYQFLYEAEKYKGNSIFGSSLPAELKEQPLDRFQALIYNQLNQLVIIPAIETHSETFKDDEQYGLTAYIKTSIWMYLLELELGKEKLHNAMKAYFNEWKFRHPYPEDLRAVLEREMKSDLTPFFDLLKKEGSL
jgi:hypothetical protein